MKRPLVAGNRMAMGAIALLAVFMIAIVWANYVSQVDLRHATVRQFTEYSAQEAAVIGQFFSERRNELVDLSDSRELTSYFENKALGMSEEYGLWASRMGIFELLDRFAGKKSLQGKTIYKMIAFVDDKGYILANSAKVPETPTLCPAFVSPLHTPGRPGLFPLTRSGEINLVMTQPFFFREEYVGTLVAWLNTRDMLSILLANNLENQWGVLEYFLFDKTVFSPLQVAPAILSEEAENGRLPGPGELVEREYALDGAASVDYLVVHSPIGDTPLCLLSLVPERELLGSMAPWQLLLYTVLLAVLLLGGAGIILGMRSRNLVLNARISETDKMSKRIEEQNTRLLDEVAARKQAEEALHKANEELEQRVEERTSALKKRSQELAREILERREAEGAMRLIFNNTHDAICIHDLEGHVIDVNERMLELFGVERDQALKLTCPEDFSDPDNPFEIMKMRRDRSMEGQEVVFEWTAKRLDTGDPFEVEVVLNRIELGGRKVLLANIHDIGEQKRIQAQQEEHRQFLNTVFEGIGAAIFVFDPTQGIMVDCNSVGEDLLSLTREEILADSCKKRFKFVSDQEKDLMCPNWDDQDTFEEGLLSLPGKPSIPISRQLFEINIGGRSHLVQVVFDITERKNLERKLSIAQKLESIGLLASGIAHEINTPIQYVGDSVRFIQEAFEDIRGLLDLYGKALAAKDSEKSQRVKDLHLSEEEIDLDFLLEEAPRACERALEGVRRVATIVLAMKNFSHPGEEKAKSVDINKAIENTVTVSRNEWKYAAKLETHLAPDLPLVHCYPGGINQVLLNVIVNAAHAIEESGRKDGDGLITITTTHDEPYVEIRIRDTGCGISEENREKVFDPFFTTKEVGKGTGQGLAIVHDIIVEKHSGTLDLESEVGKGTTFIIRLPSGDDSLVQ